MNQVKTNKISSYALSLIAVATLSCSSLSFGINIFAAINKNDHKRVKEILKYEGFDVNKADNDGNTPLHWACDNNNLDIVTLLLKSGAKKSVNITNDFLVRTPLHVICNKNNANIEIVKSLIPHCNKGYIDKEDKAGFTPLYLACEKNNKNIVELLLKKGDKKSVNTPDLHDNTPLHVACNNNNKDMVKLLLENGAIESVNKVNSDNKTPLHIACENNNLAIKLMRNKN
jgi:ankyrin repeat protein